MKFGSDVLPSRMVPYNMRHIEMDMFGVKQLKKLSKAVALASMEPTLDALSEVLSIDSRQLTDGDFHYLLAYQRIVGYSKDNLVAQWICDNILWKETTGLNRIFTSEDLKELTEKYIAATDAEKSDLQNPDFLVVEAIYCETDNSIGIALPDLDLKILTEDVLDARLDFPRMLTSSDANRMRKDPERLNLVEAARWIREGTTLEEKFAILENSPMDLAEAALKANLTHSHGVKRYVAKNCTRCNQKHISKFEITADLFFRV